MKALLEIYLRTAGVALARQHFLTAHEYMNAKLFRSRCVIGIPSPRNILTQNQPA